MKDSLIAIARQGGGVLLLDSANGKPAGELKATGGQVYAMAVSPNGELLASGGADHKIRLFDLAARKQVAELSGHTDIVRSLAWLPVANRLLSGGTDSTIRVWDPDVSQELCIAASVTGIALEIGFSEDESTLAVSTENGVRLICTNHIGKRLGVAALQSERLAPVVTALQDAQEVTWTVPVRGWLTRAVPEKVESEQVLLAASLRAGGWLGRPALSWARLTNQHSVSQASTVGNSGPAKRTNAPAD